MRAFDENRGRNAIRRRPAAQVKAKAWPKAKAAAKALAAPAQLALPAAPRSVVGTSGASLGSGGSGAVSG